mmetsp:Transcript_8442/g.17162  ORF Transcript_8442/g.17162 Transcript_8442/m.17162 type:complete len:80 (-) Transcript_8442:400-639(-)
MWPSPLVALQIYSQPSPSSMNQPHSSSSSRLALRGAPHLALESANPWPTSSVADKPIETLARFGSILLRDEDADDTGVA